MSKQILVAYASASGSTKEVAEAIAAVLAEHRFSVETHSVTEVDHIQAYDVIIVGSSIRVGKWLPEAQAFVEQHHQVLTNKLVAYFTTCLTMSKNTPEARQIVRAYMQPILNINATINPLALGLFAGSLDPTREALMPPTSPYGDYRNWPAIKTWAHKLAEQLTAMDVPITKASVNIDNLQGVILSFSDMSGLDLSEVDFSESALKETDFSEANLAASSFNWADLSKSQLSKTNLHQANFIGAILKEADLTKADLSNAILNGANLHAAKLTQATLINADLNWADLSEANLSGSNLSGASLAWTNLQAATLDGADLSGALCNAQTQWPDGFDAAAAGVIKVGHGM